MRRVLIRCDVAPSIGMGHLRRCIALAHALKQEQAFVAFLCRARHVDLEDELSSVADTWELLPFESSAEEDSAAVIDGYHSLDSNVAVIDHYRADAFYQKRLVNGGLRWLQFDWATRIPLYADWVLNANPSAGEDMYSKVLRNDQARLLLGPRYALLNEEFVGLPERGVFNEEVDKILFSFGGGDDRGATIKSLEALKEVTPSAERCILTTSVNPGLSAIRAWAKDHPKENIRVVIDAPRVAHHMREADLALLAGGTTTFEAASTGLPFFIVQTAENQALSARAWEERGVAIDLGPLANLSHEQLRRQAMSLIADRERRERMGRTAMKQVDGYGARRVAEIITTQTEAG